MTVRDEAVSSGFPTQERLQDVGPGHPVLLSKREGEGKGGGGGGMLVIVYSDNKSKLVPQTFHNIQ